MCTLYGLKELWLLVYQMCIKLWLIRTVMGMYLCVVWQMWGPYFDRPRQVWFILTCVPDGRPALTEVELLHSSLHLGIQQAVCPTICKYTTYFYEFYLIVSFCLIQWYNILYSCIKTLYLVYNKSSSNNNNNKNNKMHHQRPKRHRKYSNNVTATAMSLRLRKYFPIQDITKTGKKTPKELITVKSRYPGKNSSFIKQKNNAWFDHALIIPKGHP